MGDTGMPSDAASDSQGAVRDLLDAARGYFEDHAATFGGCWLRWDGDVATGVVAFIPPLEPHRAALDPALELVAVERPLYRLHEIQDEVFDLYADVPGVELSEAGALVQHNVVELAVFATDPAALQRDLDERYGSGWVLVHVIAPEPFAPGFVRWESHRVSHGGRRLTMRWMGGGTRNEYAVVDDDVDEVRVTIHAEYYLGGVPAVAYPLSVEVDLPTPLGERRVVDGAPYEGIARSGDR